VEVAEKSTFIKLDRNILNWRWFHDANTLKVWIYILAKANVKPRDFENITIERGQFVTSYANMAKELDMSVQSVRTALNHLKLTNEVTSTSTSKYTLISVLNYSLYQDKSTSKSTNHQQASNKPSTNDQQQYKNDKNDKNVKNVISYSSTAPQNELSKFEIFYSSYPKKKKRVEAEKAFAKLNPDDVLFQTILTALENQKQSEDWKKENGRYIPLPSSWLNGRRWEDEVPNIPKAKDNIAAYDIDAYEKMLNEK
jgi:G3E family GTPase